MNKKPTEWQGIIAAQNKDSQGEMLDIEGADISALTRVNDNHNSGFVNSLGYVTEAKKIFKKEDCETDDQRRYWEITKAPYIWAKGRLHDDQDHPAARAAAAILRNIHKHDLPLKLRASVEGSTVARGVQDPSILARTRIHSIALTFVPANHATLIEPVTMEKSDYLQDQELIKSVAHLALEDVPAFTHLIEPSPLLSIKNKIEKINSLAKALTAGYGGAGAPSALTGGGVIQKESMEKPKGFQYINCHSCGHEQPFFKEQRKCHKCGKSFSFLNLAKFFLGD